MSGIAIAGETVEQLYTACVYYIQRSSRIWEIHLVVTWDDEIHLLAVKQYYEAKGGIEGAYCSLEFDQDRIELDIPMDGIQCNGWRIIPLIFPTLTKRCVDCFRPGMRIPCIMLRAECTLEQLVGLSYKIPLQGARPPHDLIIIDIDDSRLLNGSAQKETASKTNLIKLSESVYEDYVTKFGEVFTDGFAVKDDIASAIFSWKSNHIQINGVSLGMKTVTVDKPEVRPTLVVEFIPKKDNSVLDQMEVDPEPGNCPSQDDKSSLVKTIIKTVNVHTAQEYQYECEKDPHWLKFEYTPESLFASSDFLSDNLPDEGPGYGYNTCTTKNVQEGPKPKKRKRANDDGPGSVYSLHPGKKIDSA